MIKRIALSGITGKMGRFLLDGFASHPDFKVVVGISEKEDLFGSIPIYSNIKTMFEAVEFDVFIDFTIAEFSVRACAFMLEKGIPIIVGTTGFSKSDIDFLQEKAHATGTGGIIAPNFSLGIVLLYQYLKMATQYFKEFAIYEYHHFTKQDNPSGTAHYLARAVSSSESANVTGIHGFRLPGVLATHTVVMSDETQKIELMHQSNNRHSFEEGILLAIDRIDDLDELVYGLEHIL
jgi:4-hydroxy-tetrahydrodipicolinate reductase